MKTLAMRSAVAVGTTILVAALLLTACRVVRLPDSSAEPDGALLFRIENATASQIDVTLASGLSEVEASLLPAEAVVDDSPVIETAEAEPGPEAGPEPEAARFITEEDLPPEATIRVAGGSYSEGELLCGDQVIVSASADTDTPKTVMLTGAGAGTPGFDESSVGLTGERTLLFDIHYACGDTVVIRVTDDGTGVGGSASDEGLGEVQVYPPAEVPSVGGLCGPDGADRDAAAESDSVLINIDNQTGTGISLEFLVGTGDAETDVQTDVTVLPFGLANGTLGCAQQVTLRALLIESSSGVDGTSPTLYQVTLTGDGTGAVGFDEATVGPGNTRLLLKGEHFECGDTIRVTILDDAAGVDEETDSVARIGLGTVEVVPGES